MPCLYKVSSPSGKEYIGITSQKIEDRWRQHIAYANKGSRGHLHAAIRKYGNESMIVTVLAVADYEYLKQLEIRAIKIYDTKAPNGYNLTDGGDGVLGVVITEEGRKKRSEAQKKVYLSSERKEKAKNALAKARAVQKVLGVSKERKEAFSRSMKALWESEEFRDRMKYRPTKPKIEDGLSKWQRYRLKDLDAYRKRKKEYAKTEEQRKKRTEYMREYRAKNREKTNEQARKSHQKSREKLKEQD